MCAYMCAEFQRPLFIPARHAMPSPFLRTPCFFLPSSKLLTSRSCSGGYTDIRLTPRVVYAASETLALSDIRVLGVGAALVAYLYCRDTLDTSSTEHADNTDTSACNSAAGAAQAAGSARAGAAGVDNVERAGREEWEAREEMEEPLLGCFVGLSQLDGPGKGQSVLQECCRNAVRWLTSISAAAVRWQHVVPVQRVLQVQSVLEECDQQRPLELRGRKNSFSPSFSEELSRASTPVTPAPHHPATRPTPPPSAAESVRQAQAGGGNGYATELDGAACDLDSYEALCAQGGSPKRVLCQRIYLFFGRPVWRLEWSLG
jgi:hypothetical protein